MKNKNDLLNNKIFTNINGYSLDLDQRKIILDNHQNILVVASAGSGKTLTILGKIKYLIEEQKVNYKDILCISFTNEAVLNLKQKLEYDIDVYTFHKLSLEILKENHKFYQIATSNFLEYVVFEYFESFIYNNNLLNYVLDYFNYYIKLDNLTLEIIKKDYEKLFISYQKLIIKFINLLKANNYELKDIKKILNKKLSFFKKNSYKNKCFLIIAFDIYKIYLEELNSNFRLDFDMMITRTSSLIKKIGMKRYYKYIIIDEFQDTSLARYNLIKNIQEACDSNIFAVGDDFQSIYEFSGCSNELFLNFKKYFKNSKVLYLNKTYRNSLELIKIAYRFIMRNHYQLSKKVISDKRLNKPIKIVYYTKSNYKIKFMRLLEKLYNESKREILVLGRCNHDINYVYDGKIENSYLTYLDMKIRFLTVHEAKGLEYENVIILNLRDDILGFPNKIEDDSILTLFFKKKDNYLYASERRLFYVALTRSKNYVYLMTLKNKESIFVKEIKLRCEIIDV